MASGLPWRVFLLLAIVAPALRAAAMLPQGEGRPQDLARQDPIEQHYQAAETFQLAGDFDRAETEYRRVIAESLRRVAGSKLALGEMPQALALFQSAAEADLAHLPAQMDLARAYLHAHDWENAERTARAVLTADPAYRGAQGLLGHTYLARADYERAIEHLAAEFARSRDFATAYALGLAYLKRKRLANATRIFDDVEAALPATPLLHLLLGRAYLDAEYLDVATSYFTKAIDADPATPLAHMYLGLAHLARGEADSLSRAGAAFEDELARDPANYPVRIYLAMLLVHQSKWKQAEAYLQEAIRLDPEVGIAHALLGKVHWGQGEGEAAKQALQRALELAPGSGRLQVHVHELLAEILKHDGMLERAEEHAGRAVEMRAQSQSASSPGQGSVQSPGELARLAGSPGADFAELSETFSEAEAGAGVDEESLAGLREALGSAYHNLGVIAARRGDFAAATDRFKEAASWTPALESLDRNWGMAGFRAQRFSDAIAPLERHLSQHPSDDVARQALGLCYFFVDAFAKAAEHFRPMTAVLPENPGLLYAMGVSFARDGQTAVAARVFEHMVRRNPNVAEVRLLLGQAHAEQRDFDTALQEFGQALALDPRLPEAHYSAGIVRIQQGKMDDAEADFRAELALNPEHISAGYHLGVALVGQQKYEEAIAVLQRIIEREPSHADAFYQMGRALLESGAAAQAVEVLKTSIRLQPNNDYSHYQLSMAYRRQGLTAEAQQALQQYQKLRQTGREAERQRRANQE